MGVSVIHRTKSRTITKLTSHGLGHGDNYKGTRLVRCSLYHTETRTGGSPPTHQISISHSQCKMIWTTLTGYGYGPLGHDKEEEGA
jgi:hypothetical protein